MRNYDPQPKNLKELFGKISLDFKLVAVYHFSMAFLMIVSSFLTTRIEFCVALIEIAILSLISYQHKQKHGWRWKRPQPVKIIATLASSVFFVIFIVGAVGGWKSMNNPRVFPWCLAGAGLIFAGFLNSLNLANFLQKEFMAQCQNDNFLPSHTNEKSRKPNQPLWKTAIQVFFYVFFLTLGLLYFGYFYKSDTLYKNGTTTPSIERQHPVTRGGRTVYITDREKAELDLLGGTVSLGWICFFILIIPLGILKIIPVRGFDDN